MQEQVGQAADSSGRTLPDAETAEADPVARLEADLTEAEQKYLRLYADFENYKKRIARDRIQLIQSASAETMEALLPVLDDMERALKAMNEAKEVDALKEGLNLVYQKMKNVTESRGLKPMETLGKPFDSDLHDAITNIPAPSEELKGKVVEEVQKGYYLYDKVLRHAKVIVGS